MENNKKEFNFNIILEKQKEKEKEKLIRDIINMSTDEFLNYMQNLENENEYEKGILTIKFTDEINVYRNKKVKIKK